MSKDSMELAFFRKLRDDLNDCGLEAPHSDQLSRQFFNQAYSKQAEMMDKADNKLYQDFFSGWVKRDAAVSVIELLAKRFEEEQYSDLFDRILEENFSELRGLVQGHLTEVLDEDILQGETPEQDMREYLDDIFPEWQDHLK